MVVLYYKYFTGTGRRTFVFDRSSGNRAVVSDEIIERLNLQRHVKVIDNEVILTIPLVGGIDRFENTNIIEQAKNLSYIYGNRR
jgi:hypothetical protein